MAEKAPDFSGYWIYGRLGAVNYEHSYDGHRWHNNVFGGEATCRFLEQQLRNSTAGNDDQFNTRIASTQSIKKGGMTIATWILPVNIATVCKLEEHGEFSPRNREIFGATYRVFYDFRDKVPQLDAAWTIVEEADTIFSTTIFVTSEK